MSIQSAEHSKYIKKIKISTHEYVAKSATIQTIGRYKLQRSRSRSTQNVFVCVLTEIIIIVV